MSPLYSQNSKNYASRDNVTFVKADHYNGDMKAMAKEVLKKIPKDLTEFMLSKDIFPNPPMQNIHQMNQLMHQQSIIDQNFYTIRKNAFIKECFNRGMPEDQIIAYLQVFGTPCEDSNYIKITKDVPNYANIMKMP